MSERIIPITPEHETTEERFFWDQVINALSVLSEHSNEVDVFADIEDLRGEYQEDALMYLFSYYISIDTPEGETDSLAGVETFLAEYGFIE